MDTGGKNHQWFALGEIAQRGCGISALEVFKTLLDKAVANLIQSCCSWAAGLHKLSEVPSKQNFCRSFILRDYKSGKCRVLMGLSWSGTSLENLQGRGNLQGTLKVEAVTPAV